MDPCMRFRRTGRPCFSLWWRQDMETQTRRSRRCSSKSSITSLVMTIFKIRVLCVLTGILGIVRSKASSSTKNQVSDCLATNWGTGSFAGRLAVHCRCYLPEFKERRVFTRYTSTVTVPSAFSPLPSRLGGNRMVAPGFGSPRYTDHVDYDDWQTRRSKGNCSG